VVAPPLLGAHIINASAQVFYVGSGFL